MAAMGAAMRGKYTFVTNPTFPTRLDIAVCTLAVK
jgi:hypothetical protein